MRIADVTSRYFTIRRINNTSENRNHIHAKVRAAGYGFTGTNPSVWFDRMAIERFVRELRGLDQTREGSATLETLSPGECELTIHNADRCGHIQLVATIVRSIYEFEKYEYLRCRLNFEVNPTTFPQIIEDLAEETPHWITAC